MAEEKKKGMTFRVLKQEIEKLSDEQLDAEVIWWGDERGGEIQHVLVLPEDYIRDPSEGVSVPISCYRDGFVPGDYGVSSWDEFLVENPITMKAGTPVLCTDEV